MGFFDWFDDDYRRGRMRERGRYDERQSRKNNEMLGGVIFVIIVLIVIFRGC